MPIQLANQGPDHSPIARLQPHWRLATALVLAFLLAVQPTLPALLPGLVYGLLLFLFARPSWRCSRRRFLWVNLVVVGLALCLAVAAPGRVVLRLPPLTVTASGLLAAAVIIVKCNAVLLITMALIGSLEPIALGHSLRRLHMPRRLVLLSFLMLRYADVLQDEYQILRRCLQVRGFRPGLGRHRLRALGYLVGNLLLRSFERAERVLQAMQCRGFNGEFPTFQEDQRSGFREYLLGVTALATAAAVLWGGRR